MTPSETSGNADKLTRDPSGQPVLLVMEPRGGSLTRRMCQAMGALQWFLPNKAMVEAERVRLPDWPPDIAAWKIKQRPIAPLTWPGHDLGPVAVYSLGSGWRKTGAMPWEALL